MTSYNDGLTPTQRAWLQAQHNREALADLTAQEINQMPLGEFARLTGRLDIVPVAVSEADSPRPTLPTQTSTAGTAPAPEGIDPSSPEYFHAWRAQRKSGGEGVGILNQQGGTDAWVAAAQRQPGRSGWQGSNVEPSPDMSRTMLPTQPVQGRTSIYR